LRELEDEILKSLWEFMVMPGAIYRGHTALDKVYQDWVDLYWTGTDLFSSSPMATITGESSINPNSIIDRRDQKVWYAEDGIVLLDKYETSGTEFYNYTTGSIVSEDFTVISSSDVEFRTGGESIHLKTGFKVENGASFIASRGTIGGASLKSTSITLEDQTKFDITNIDPLSDQEVLVSVYPNPSIGTFRITASINNIETFSVAIYDMQGNMIYHNQLFQNGELVSLNGSNPGLYMLHINLSENNYQKKIIIE